MGAVSKAGLGRIVLIRTGPPRPRLSLQELGFDEEELRLMRAVLALPRGLVLFAGTEGDGRTTTLGAARGAIAAAGDPPPLVFEDIVSRRDAVEAVQRSRERLVLVAIRADDGTAALARFTSFGVEMSEVTRALVGAIAQRLARKLCPHCVRRYDPSASELGLLDLTTLTPGACFAEGVGCERCSGSGREGKVPVVEILARPPGTAPSRRTLRASALSRLLAGIISTEEAIAVLDGRR